MAEQPLPPTAPPEASATTPPQVRDIRLIDQPMRAGGTFDGVRTGQFFKGNYPLDPNYGIRFWPRSLSGTGIHPVNVFFELKRKFNNLQASWGQAPNYCTGTTPRERIVYRVKRDGTPYVWPTNGKTDLLIGSTPQLITIPVTNVEVLEIWAEFHEVEWCADAEVTRPRLW